MKINNITELKGILLKYYIPEVVSIDNEELCLRLIDGETYVRIDEDIADDRDIVLIWFATPEKPAFMHDENSVVKKEVDKMMGEYNDMIEHAFKAEEWYRSLPPILSVSRPMFSSSACTLPETATSPPSITAFSAPSLCISETVSSRISSLRVSSIGAW